ncbi:glycosyltransferase family 39 protein [candidate division WWE3 bacterium]|uniref:Glycosyltransferase family 39 protein n=1 Tax=candidate division WWE3 bacterium TaxID=2053526 RepID=A0A955RWX9_UNCKA|nr:glycosyltransferase family 39 protein [candidate division WWE3 bacterium]
MKEVVKNFQSRDKTHTGERLLIIFLGILVFVNFSVSVNAWQLQYFSDEWEFYTTASEIAQGEYSPNIFDLNGVYEENPIFGSYYHAFFLKIFGQTPLVWKFSNGILLIPIVVFFFYWVKEYFDQATAWVATLLFSSSHILAHYTKIGYPNHLAFLLFIVSLFIIQRIMDEKSIRYVVLLGALWGISFYVFIGPLFPVMQFPLLLPLFQKSLGEKRDRWLPKAVVGAVSYLLIVLPGVLITDSTHWHSIQQLLGRGGNPTLFVVATNIVKPLFLFIFQFFPMHTHFSGGRLVDPIVLMLILVGVVVLLKMAKDRDYVRYFIAAFIATGITIGVSNMYEHIGVTRGVFMLPFWFVMAGVGVVWILRHSRLVGGMLVVAVSASSLYFTHVTYFSQADFHVNNYLIHELRGNSDKVTFMAADPLVPNPLVFDDVMRSYGYTDRIEKVVLSGEQDVCQYQFRTIVVLREDTGLQTFLLTSDCLEGGEIIVLDRYYY